MEVDRRNSGLSNLPLLVLVMIFLQETRGGVTLQKLAKMLREATGDERYRAEMDLRARNIKEMLHSSSVKAIPEPVVFAFGLWIAFAWSSHFYSCQ